MPATRLASMSACAFGMSSSTDVRSSSPPNASGPCVSATGSEGTYPRTSRPAARPSSPTWSARPPTPCSKASTASKLAKLHRELAQIRRRGYAINNQQTETGLTAIGIAITDTNHTLRRPLIGDADRPLPPRPLGRPGSRARRDRTARRGRPRSRRRTPNVNIVGHRRAGAATAFTATPRPRRAGRRAGACLVSRCWCRSPGARDGWRC